MRDDYRRHSQAFATAEPLFGAWSELADAIGANISLAPAWTRITAESHGLLDITEVVTVYRDAELVAVLPIFVATRKQLGFRVRTLELVSNRVSYHNQLISSLAPEPALDMLLSLAAEKQVDIIRLANVCDDSEFAAWLRDGTSHKGFHLKTIPTESSPYLPIASSWDELLASKPKKFRYKARKRAEAVDTQDDLRVALHATTEDCDDLLAVIRIVEEHSWKQAAGISVFDREHERRYFAMLLPALAREGAMFAHVLYKNEQPIAYNLCCLHRGWVGQMKTSFDTRFSKLSPGSTLIDIGIRTAIEKGASEFDFLGDADRHKMAWSKSIRDHTDYFLYLDSSIKGRSLAVLKGLKDRLTRSSRNGEQDGA